jgi:c-di-GMP-related signal transduction protein
MSETTTCSWLHCFLIEHVENTEKTWENTEKNGPHYFSGQYIDLLRNELFSDDFGFKMNTLVSNLAHIIFILRRPLIILSKNIVYLEGILHFRQWKSITNQVSLPYVVTYERHRPYRSIETISEYPSVAVAVSVTS